MQGVAEQRDGPGERHDDRLRRRGDAQAQQGDPQCAEAAREDSSAVGAARPAVSQHLAKLRLAGLVAVRRQGRRAVYRIDGSHVRRLVSEALYAAEHQVSGRPSHHPGSDAGLLGT